MSPKWPHTQSLVLILRGAHTHDRLCPTSSACALLRMRAHLALQPAHDVKQPISFPRRMSAPGICNFASLTPNEGWAERRETFGCVRGTRGAYHDAIRQALARRLASLGVGRSPLGAPPWRFFTRGRASVSGITRIRAASSSQPGRSAWRAGSRASRGQRLRAAAAGRHASLRLQDRLRRRPSMSAAANVLAQPRFVVNRQIRFVDTLGDHGKLQNI